MKSQHQHHWQLRLEHLGFSHIRMDWVSGTVHFNPRAQIDPSDICVILGGWPEQISGVLEQLQSRSFCHVVAPEVLIDWLLEQGWPQDKLHTSWKRDGFSIDLETYQPIPWLTLKEAVRKGISTIRNPVAPLLRLRSHLGSPMVPPHMAWITFPSGKRLAHLNCGFHQRQETRWLDSVIQRASEATWVLVGADYEEYEACFHALSRIQSEHVLLTDLVGDYRRQAGLPSALLTPLADRVTATGRLVQLFPTQVTHRFDTVVLSA